MATSDRRGFLKILAGVFGSAIAAAATVPVLGAALTPLIRRKEDDANLIKAVPEKDLVVGIPRRVELTSVVVDGWTRAVGVVGAAWLLKKPDGSISALSSICPHSGCSIGQKTKETYGCPCHASAFSFDGTPLEGPSPRTMDPLTVEVKDGSVFVKWMRFKVGVKERKPA